MICSFEDVMYFAKRAKNAKAGRGKYIKQTAVAAASFAFRFRVA